MQEQLEPAGPISFDADLAAGEGAVDRRVQGCGVADLADGLQRRRHVGPVGAEDQGPGADLAAAGGGGGVGPDVVIEPPGPDPLTQAEYLGRALRISELAQHAVVRPDGIVLRPGAVVAPDADDAVAPVAEQGRRPERWPVPDALPLDLRIPGERSLATAGRKAEVDGIAEIIPGEPQPQADRLGPDGALHRVTAFPYRSPGLLRAGPQRRRQATLAGQRSHGPVPCRASKQAQRPVQAGLAAAIGAGHHVQRRKRDNQPPQRPVVLNRERGHHAPDGTRPGRPHP